MSTINHQESLELIKLFNRLRVTDIRDGMDWMGYHFYGSMYPTIKPLFRPRTATVGIAKTGRSIPYQGPVPMLTEDDYTEWAAMYYREICTCPWDKNLSPGDFICIDMSGQEGVNAFGSANTLWQKKQGVVGWLTGGGGVRDTDECVLQGINVWGTHVSHPMGQARIHTIDVDIPIGIAGVAIFPGDVVVADGDGVIVVPRKIARDVAKWAWHEASNDKKGRKQMYIDLGMELDETV